MLHLVVANETDSVPPISWHPSLCVVHCYSKCLYGKLNISSSFFLLFGDLTADKNNTPIPCSSISLKKCISKFSPWINMSQFESIIFAYKYTLKITLRQTQVFQPVQSFSYHRYKVGSCTVCAVRTREKRRQSRRNICK